MVPEKCSGDADQRFCHAICAITTRIRLVVSVVFMAIRSGVAYRPELEKRPEVLNWTEI